GYLHRVVPRTRKDRSVARATRRVSVLIAEDDGPVRDALAALIRSEPGLKLIGAAKDADEAVRLAAEMRPDVALLDVRMPGGGGVTAARELKRCSPGTRVVALSASGERESV